jgi:pimeloyl-ACP methyl ester carboxylesterase
MATISGRSRQSHAIACMLAASLVFGCVPRTRVPIEFIRYDANARETGRMLFVFLPGNGDAVTVFEKRRIIEAVRERGLQADMIAVNAHIGYYLNGSVFTRLKEDVIDPAKARGYAQIWMVGNSLGGYGSISYMRSYPDDVSGVVLLGPFLGDKELIGEIKKAGGLSTWDPGIIRDNSMEDWNKHIWLWVKGCAKEKQSKGRIYLGYGLNDRFSFAQAFLASSLSPEHVIAINGGHDWSTWMKIWDLFLDRDIFSASTMSIPTMQQ